tara:strand:+ start:185 stop:526 length:342 start_codon:yes stop_codon:yes gene_type:complete
MRIFIITREESFYVPIYLSRLLQEKHNDIIGTAIATNASPHLSIFQLYQIAVFLLHPWRVGQKKYIGALELFFDKVNYPCISTEELVRSKKGIALTGDVGEMSLIEIAKRVLT